jgi:uncharacterized FAD-dependent dehydrogenase
LKKAIWPHKNEECKKMNNNKNHNLSRQPSDCQYISISHLEVPLRQITEESRYSLDHRLHPWIAKHCRIHENDVRDYKIRHRSLDARRKPDIRFIYQLSVTIRANSPVREDKTITFHTPAPDQNHRLYQLNTLSSLTQHPIVVGTGPAGMMAAYLFALYGCKPLILERGYDVEQRRADIESFLHTRRLHPESNYLFGEGGAGTFSDGKLYTRIKDQRINFLLEAYVAARAPRRILYDHYPHIGSDILPYMVRRLRKQIEEWGGSFRWETNVQDILIRNNHCCGVILENGEPLEGPLTLIASGHSARKLIRKLIQRGIKHQAKDFQLGSRIEHPQHLIDQAQYGWIPPRHLVSAAEYRLTSRPWERRHPAHKKNGQAAHAPRDVSNVTTFCMCPGGEIIAATSHEGQLCTNGMSRFLRNGDYANAGLIVNQTITRFPSALNALEFINELEQHAFSAGGSNYSCPAQSAVSFVRGEEGLHTTETSYRLGITSARIDQLLPRDTVNALREALKYFENLIPGFMKSGVLLGVETRISSPVRFERNPETLSSSLSGLYLAGEGAGYAGGITSAALDGLRIVETILTGKTAKRKVSS